MLNILKSFIIGTIPHHLQRVDMYGYDKNSNNRLFVADEHSGEKKTATSNAHNEHNQINQLDLLANISKCYNLLAFADGEKEHEPRREKK